MEKQTQRIAPGLFSLNGVTELHCETPTPEFLHLARAVGLKEVVIKWPGGADSAPMAEFANYGAKEGPVFFGGVVLDRPVGGMNCSAVRSSANRAGRFVWMPTVDAQYHRQINGFCEEDSIRLLDEKGELLQKVRAVIEAASECNMILGTGHISPEEAEQVIKFACESGVKRVIVNHPLLLGYSLETMKRIASFPGVFIEHCYVPDHPKKFDVGRIIEAIEAIGIERTLIADFGAFGRDANIADALIVQGLSVETVFQLTAINASKFLERE